MELLAKHGVLESSCWKVKRVVGKKEKRENEGVLIVCVGGKLLAGRKNE